MAPRKKVTIYGREYHCLYCDELFADTPGDDCIRCTVCKRWARRDLARNEEFSEIAVINIFFTVLKTKTQLYVGGGGGPAGKFRDKSRN